MSEENPFKKLRRIKQKIKDLELATELHIQGLKDEQNQNSESPEQTQDEPNGTGERTEVEP